MIKFDIIPGVIFIYINLNELNVFQGCIIERLFIIVLIKKPEHKIEKYFVEQIMWIANKLWIVNFGFWIVNGRMEDGV